MRRSFGIRNPLLCISMLVIILSICYGYKGGDAPFQTATADARMVDSSRASVTCPNVAAPNPQSLLVVLLDRSGSLTDTDPNGYATSATKAMADLWPGLMAVIPFSGDTTLLPTLGPYAVSDSVQREELKNQVGNYPISGETPLAPAMHQALELFRGAASGSRGIIITDGEPSGTGSNDNQHQEQDILRVLIPQFCAQGIPISAIGLKISSQNANQLLTNITQATNALYANVSSPEGLAHVIISAYAQWQHLSFTQVSPNVQGNFLISIDPFVQQSTIVTFRSDSKYKITLFGPSGESLTQGVELSTDRHYEIDSLASEVVVPGVYTVNTGGDPNAQVYALVKSSLRVQLISPTSKAITFIKSPIQIEAAFYNGQILLTPQNNQAQIMAHVTLLVNGQPVGSSVDLVLAQQGALFVGQIPAYSQLGEVQIEISGTYLQTERQTFIRLQLHTPLLCRQGLLQCFWQMYVSQILIFTPLILVLIVFLVLLFTWVVQPMPYGWLYNEVSEVRLGLSRKFSHRVYHPSVISSDELQDLFDFRFGMARFDLIFSAEGRVKIKLARNSASKIDIKTGETVASITERGFELEDGSVINIDGRDVATFSEYAPKNYWLSGRAGREKFI